MFFSEPRGSILAKTEIQRRAKLLRTTLSDDSTFFSFLCEQFNSRDRTFPGTLKISQSRKGDYKVSAAEVKWPPTNDLIYKLWSSAKTSFLSPPRACIKKLYGPFRTRNLWKARPLDDIITKG